MPSVENQLSRWGAVSKALQDVPPSAKVFFVGDANDAWFGDFQNEFPVDRQGGTRVFSTVDAVFNDANCVAGRGDVILVMPGHNENISAATSLVMDKAAVSVIGLGQGNNRPTFTFTNTAGSIEMDSANCRLSNVRLVASVSAVVVGINVDAAGCRIDHCESNFDETGDDFVTLIDVDAVNRAWIHDNEFYTEETAGAAECIRLDDCDQVAIERNVFSGQWSDSPIVGEGAVGTSLLIADNTFYNADTGAQNGIDLNVAFTGVIRDNRIGSLYATSVTDLLDPGSCLCFNNICNNAIDRKGVEIPTTATTS